MVLRVNTTAKADRFSFCVACRWLCCSFVIVSVKSFVPCCGVFLFVLVFPNFLDTRVRLPTRRRCETPGFFSTDVVFARPGRTNVRVPVRRRHGRRTALYRVQAAIQQPRSVAVLPRHVLELRRARAAAA